MKYIDIKVTVWHRLSFTDETNMEEMIQSIENSGIDEIIDDEKGFIEIETLYDTEEKLEPIDNGGQSTIEVYENNELKWENGSDTITNESPS